MKRKTMLLGLALCTIFSVSACQSDNKMDDSLRGTIENVASIDPISLGGNDTVSPSSENLVTGSLSTENGISENPSVGSDDTANPSSESTDIVSPSVESDDLTDSSGTDAISTPAASDETGIASTAGESSEISLGHTESNIYKSTFLGIGCKFDASWTFMSDEQIKENNKLASEMIDNKAITNALESGSILTDMMVQNTTTGSNTSIAIEKLHSSMKNVNEEDYIDIVAPQMVGTLESAGFSDVTTEKVTITFAGKECYALKITSSVNNVAVNQLQVPIKKGDYMACVTSTAFGDSTTDEMITAFYTLDN